MLRMAFSAFLILHGLVHLLYFGHSREYFELQPGLEWPDDSWLLADRLDRSNLRLVAAVLMLLSAIAFLVAGQGRFFSAAWWPSIAYLAVAISSASYLGFWDGTVGRLPDQGAVALALNLVVVILTAIL